MSSRHCMRFWRLSIFVNLFFLIYQLHLGLINAARRYITGGRENEPMAVMNAALTSSGVLISPLMTFEIEVSINLSTVVSMGFMIAGIAAKPMSVGKK